MTDAPETDASFLVPVSGACVMGTRIECSSHFLVYTEADMYVCTVCSTSGVFNLVHFYSSVNRAANFSLCCSRTPDVDIFGISVLMY